MKLLKVKIQLSFFRTIKNTASTFSLHSIFAIYQLPIEIRAIGIPVNALVTRTLNDEEKYPIEQLLIDDEVGPLGPGGTRALMTALMGTGPGMKGGPYKLMKSIRIWRSNCHDEGAAAIVSQLSAPFCECNLENYRPRF